MNSPRVVQVLHSPLGVFSPRLKCKACIVVVDVYEWLIDFESWANQIQSDSKNVRETPWEHPDMNLPCRQRAVCSQARHCCLSYLHLPALCARLKMMCSSAKVRKYPKIPKVISDKSRDVVRRYLLLLKAPASLLTMAAPLQAALIPRYWYNDIIGNDIVYI